ncbi:9831_t:CDS:2, partial [Racocetra persica]
QLEQILEKLDNTEVIYNSAIGKKREKRKWKKTADDLFQEAVRELLYELFHDYKQISDTEMKVQLKNKLENNKDCAEHLKGLWATFGISKIKSFNEHDTKDQMKQWKQDSRKAYKDLYNLNNLTNPNSDTFFASIIQYVFVSKDEQTHINAIWT